MLGFIMKSKIIPFIRFSEMQEVFDALYEKNLKARANPRSRLVRVGVAVRTLFQTLGYSIRILK